MIAASDSALPLISTSRSTRDVQHPVAPHEAELTDRLAQVLGDAAGGVERAVGEQHAELVAAETRQQVGGADAGLHDAGDLLEEPVAGLMAAGVVDDLELVEGRGT